MRTRKSHKPAVRSARGAKAVSKRRHARKPAVPNRTAELVTRKLETLTPL